MKNPPPGLRSKKPFGRARPLRPLRAEVDATTLLRERLQLRIDRYQRDALRRAIRGETRAAAALMKSAERLKAIRRG